MPLLHFCVSGKTFFYFNGFAESHGHDTHPNPFLRFLFNLGRNLKATGPWFALGILLSAIFQRYVPAELVGKFFGPQKQFGLLLAATVGVPLYVCGGGTIPMLRDWLAEGMSLGTATAFMVTGPCHKNHKPRRPEDCPRRKALYALSDIRPAILAGDRDSRQLHCVLSVIQNDPHAM